MSFCLSVTRWLPAVLAALLLTTPLQAEEPAAPAPFDAAEEDAIREIVREYILANPEVIVESMQVFRERQRLADEQAAREAVVAQRDTLVGDPNSPVVGNPDGDVTVVEFFDYRCPYCIRVAEALRDTVGSDGNIRLVMKEFPILGPESTKVAQLALASEMQGRYEEFHFALMEAGGKVTEARALKVADKIGLDVDQLRRDMQAPEIEAQLQSTYNLAQALQIRGTPAFVVGDTVVRGAIDMATLRQLVAGVRAGSS